MTGLELLLAKRPEELTEADVIYDWNELQRPGPLFRRAPCFYDETLRDGIQSPSVVDPRIDDKLQLVHLANDLGIQHINIGLPGAGPRAFEDALRLATEIRDARLAIKPGCAGRTHPNDVRPILELAQRAGIEIEVMTFLGSSPIRLYAEGWDLDLMLRRSAEAIDLAVGAGLPCTFVTEDTTRSRPEVLDRLFRTAVDHGARRLALCDTVGHATPDGIRNLIAFTRSLLDGMGASVGIDWHGHNDRGLGVTNAIYALEYGAERVHGTALGIGERVGNAALDQVLMNLKLLGALPDQDLSKLLLWCKTTARACRVAIPPNYPLVGEDAFRTATGVHAAAVIKAERKGHAFLADRIYSGVPAGMFGREQVIEVGHMSGESNVIYWLRKRHLEPEPELVTAIFQVAKARDHILTDDEILQVVKDFRTGRPLGAPGPSGANGQP